MNHRTSTTKRRPAAKEPPGDVTQGLASAASPVSASIEEDTRRQLIAVEAYFLAERRGFTPGCELDDWLAAEAIIERRFPGMGASGQVDAAGRAPSLA